ncbi:hypothetical protein H8959_000706 [Pygathrix nigripes]
MEEFKWYMTFWGHSIGKGKNASERNRVWDRDVYLVIEDLKQKASEYKSEAKYLKDLLTESANFSPASLSSTGSRYLNALVGSAVALETKDASLTSFIPTVNDLTSDLFHTKSKSEEIKIEWEKLEEKSNCNFSVRKMSTRGSQESRIASVYRKGQS